MPADVGQCEEARPIHSRLAMDVDCPRSFTQKPLHGSLKLWIPVQDVHIDAVDGIQTLVPMGESVREPLGCLGIVRTVDDVRNSVFGCKPLG
jgi:hypothetical protein